MKIVIASDHGGITIRKDITSLLKEMNLECIALECDCAISVDYPDFAFTAT